MAAAEARAAWQRTINRCLVQEDAKRAPKLACCPSSTPQNDSSSGNAAGTQDCPVLNFMPLSRNIVKTHLSPETKWWLQLQPNFGYQKDFICEQSSCVEVEVDEDIETTAPKTKLDEESTPVDSIDFILRKAEPFLESPCTVSTAFMKHGSETMVQDINISTSSSQHLVKQKVDMLGYLFKEVEFLDSKPADRIITKRPEKSTLNLEMPWSGANKSDPWWRIADQDELALLVAQKSMEHFENCDLPKPTQIVNVAVDPFSPPENLDVHGRFKPSFGGRLNAGLCNSHDFSHTACSPGGSDDSNYSAAGETACCMTRRNFTGKTSVRDSSKTEQPETNQTSEKDPSRAQLLEALRHSQTRARKAEMAAQEANNEKEHIVQLLFREASHLFACKQWLQMLQLERLCLQLRVKDNQIIPALPWMSLKGKRFGKYKETGKGRKRHKCKICKYLFFFAVGLGLVGVGLLLGWTIGWLFPS